MPLYFPSAVPFPVVMLLAGIVTAHLVAGLFYRALGSRRWLRSAAFAALAAGLLALPLAIPLALPYAPLLRSFLAVDAALIVSKLWELHRSSERPPLREYLGHVLPITFWNLSYRRRDRTASPPRLLRTLGFSVVSLLGGLTGLWLAFFVVDLGRVHFLLDHGAKALGAVLAATGMQNVAACLRALATGKPTLLPFDAPLLAATPAEFWRRWNRSVSQYLHEAVFKPLGGIHHPVRGLLAAFAVSGVLHEYVYSIALMRVQGYQLAFWALQGLAVTATAGVRPRGPRRHLWRAATLLFLFFSSILFFASNVALFAPLFRWHPHGAWLP